jgi:hypothetical protein
VKGFPDQLVDHSGPVVFGGVDVIHPGVHSRTEDRDGFVTVARWAKDAVSG